jgi:hypothetical protein
VLAVVILVGVAVGGLSKHPEQQRAEVVRVVRRLLSGEFGTPKPGRPTDVHACANSKARAHTQSR